MCSRGGVADLLGFVLHVHPLRFARHIARAFAQSIVHRGESAHVFLLQLRQLAEQLGNVRRMRVRVGGPLRRLWLIRMSPVRLLPMACLAIGRRAARWLRVRRRMPTGATTAAADSEAATDTALLGRLAAIRLTALFAVRTVPTAPAHIRSSADLNTATLSLLGRNTAAVRQPEAAAARVDQASSRSGGVEGKRHPARDRGCSGQRQRAAGQSRSAGPQQRMRTEHGAVKESRCCSGDQSKRMDRCREKARQVAVDALWRRLNRLRSRRLRTVTMTVTAAQRRRVAVSELTAEDRWAARRVAVAAPASGMSAAVSGRIRRAQADALAV